MKRNLTLLAAIIILSLTAMAQSRNINLTISITGPGNTPLPNATVTLMQTDYSLSYGTIKLNSEGQAKIKVYAGNHKLGATMAGYNPAETTFSVTRDTTVTLQLSEENLLPFSLQTTVTHNSVTGLNDVKLTWNKEAPVFYDSFESYTPFYIKFGEWTGIDADGLNAAPLVGEYMNRGVMQYAQIINPLTVVPAWWYDYPILRPHSGQQYVGFTRTLSGQANDDWLISPTITPGNKNVLAFMAKAADIYKEKFQVFITEKLDNPVQADFRLLNPGNYETADYTGWREFSYDLSEYAGKPIKFAIRYISETLNGGAFMLQVDDVYVGQDQSVFRAKSREQHAIRVETQAERSPMNPNETFRIYLDGNLVGTTDQYEYVFTDLPAGTYTLGVQAVYSASETEIVTTSVTISDLNSRVTINVATNNNRSVDGQQVELIDLATTQTFTATIAGGVAQFPSIPHGEYLIGITAPHFNVYEGNLTVSGECSTNVTLTETIVDPYNITTDADPANNVTVRWNRNISFNDSFEDYPDFARGSFGDWRTYDLDLHPVYPIALGGMSNIISFPGSGTASNPQPIAPLVFNPWSTTPPMMPTDPAVQAPTGNKSIAFFSAQQNGSNKWLISPEIKIRKDFVCRFTAKAYAEYPESMDVCVFTDGANPTTDNYTQVSSIKSVTTGVWTIYETDLADFVDQTVRIGIHYTSFDAFFAQLDDFYVGNGETEGSTIDVGFVDHYDIFLDGTLQSSVDETEFILPRLSAGQHTVGIRAVYTSGASQTVEYTFTLPEPKLTGDINDDGTVDVLDLNILINILVGTDSADNYNGRANVNGTGAVDVADINALVNIMLGK